MLINTRLTYATVLKSIRELAKDIVPCPSFNCEGQGFTITIGTDSITMTKTVEVDGQPELVTHTLPITDETKTYEVANFISPILGQPIYLSAYSIGRYVKDNLSVADAPNDIKVFSSQYYFSEREICEKILEYFIKQSSGNPWLTEYFSGIFSGSVNVESEINVQCYEELSVIILWVAYWLIDKRREDISTLGFIQTAAGQPSVTQDFVNKTTSITSKLGDSHIITEQEAPAGIAEQGMSYIWGDKDTYLAKLQVYLRNVLEKKYGFYGLRDNLVVSSTFRVNKHYTPYSYDNSIGISKVSEDILSKSFE